MDNGGDLDAVVGEANGNLNYFRNDGSASSASFSQLTGASNPFDGIDVGSDASSSLAVMDGDGDFDLLVGEESGAFTYFENTGSAGAATFSTSGTSNPWGLSDIGVDARVDLADIDGDGDLDLIVGEGDDDEGGSGSGTINYFLNNSQALEFLPARRAALRPSGSTIGSKTAPGSVCSTRLACPSTRCTSSSRTPTPWRKRFVLSVCAGPPRSGS